MSKPTKGIVGVVKIVKAGFAKKHRADWNKIVYHEHSDGFYESLGMDEEDWRALKYWIIKRDKRRCQRCDKRFKILELNAHHIVPRDEGGSNHATNLMTLCIPCHDFVEISGLRTKADIAGSYRDNRIDRTEDHEPLIARIENLDWHSWVYGGKRRQRGI
jgi:5-methylcytosine-specific restriction endonuclease McrA